MSEENVEVARRLYANPLDLAAARDLAAPDVEIDFTAMYPDMEVVHGFDNLLRFQEAGPWEYVSLRPERFFDIDDERVLVFVRVEARGRGSEVPMTQRTAHALTVRDGLISALRFYLDREEALEACGLKG